MTRLPSFSTPSTPADTSSLPGKKGRITRSALSHGRVINTSMKITDIIGESAGVGLVVPGVNMPAGMHPDEIRRQSRKFGNRVTNDGVPPVASTDGLDAVKEGRRRRRRHKMKWLKRLLDLARKDRRRFYEEVWDKPSSKKHGEKLTPAQKAAAKARADRAGRRYPNLIDNMWAATH